MNRHCEACGCELTSDGFCVRCTFAKNERQVSQGDPGDETTYDPLAYVANRRPVFGDEAMDRLCSAVYAAKGLKLVARANGKWSIHTATWLEAITVPNN